MTFWHYRLLPLLPVKELYLTQCVLSVIEGGYYKIEYPLGMCLSYKSLILEELKNRKLSYMKWGFNSEYTKSEIIERIYVSGPWESLSESLRDFRVMKLARDSNLNPELKAWKRYKIKWEEVPDKYKSHGYKVYKDGDFLGRLCVTTKVSSKNHPITYHIKYLGYWPLHKNISQVKVSDRSFPKLFPNMWNDRIWLEQYAELLEMGAIVWDKDSKTVSRVENSDGIKYIDKLRKRLCPTKGGL